MKADTTLSMHSLRDCLDFHGVFERACRERQVEFTEIDLRWGVTKEDAEQGKLRLM